MRLSLSSSRAKIKKVMPQEPTLITEQDLLQEGFERHTAEDGSYYYFRRFSPSYKHKASPLNSPIDLITDETNEEEGWTVSMYDHNWIKFRHTKDLYKIVSLLESFS